MEGIEEFWGTRLEMSVGGESLFFFWESLKLNTILFLWDEVDRRIKLNRISKSKCIPTYL